MNRLLPATSRLASILLLGVSIGVPVVLAAPHDAQQFMDSLHAGGWLLHERGGRDRRLCVSRGGDLAFAAHRSAGCRILHSRAAPDRIEVNYVCPGGVQGMTRIRRETASLVHIETQGIAGGNPFANSWEARWIGACNRPIERRLRERQPR
jgi:hypothetical protein